MAIYYGWCIVAVSVLANMLVVGATYSVFGLFVLPVSAEYNLSRANMNTALILLNIGGAATAPVLGRMLDRFPARRIMMGCAVLLGLSLATLGLSRSLWLSAAVLIGPFAAGILGSAGMTMNVLTARWFVKQRGRAMALSVLGLSLGSVVVAPIIALLIESQGWRATLVIVGAAVSGLLLMLSLFVRDRPGAADVEGGRPVAGAMADAVPSRPTQVEPPLAVGAVLRMPQFWSIALASALAMGMAQTLTISLVPLALGGGLTLIQATSLISITGASALASKLLLAVVADKVDRVILLTALFGLGALLNAALFASDGYVLLCVCAVILGVTTGALAPVIYTLLADRFGAASFGTVRGLSAPISAVMGAVSVRFAGEVYDRTGGYDLMFATFLAAQLLAAGLMFATRFIKPPPVVARPAATGL